MVLRLIACGAIACCLVAGDAVASTDPAEAKMFKGKTSQGYRIKVAVKEQAFKIHVFEIDLRCRNGSELGLIEGGFLWTKTAKRGSFRDAQFGRTDSVYFRGRLNERRIRGKVRVTDRLRNGTRCASRWIGFKAGLR